MKRPTGEPPSKRKLSRDLGVSRSFMWRAEQVASIPETEFEALVEGESPPTVSQLVAHARGRSAKVPTFTLPPDLLAALDRHIAEQPGPRPSRPEAIRRVLARGLKEEHDVAGD